MKEHKIHHLNLNSMKKLPASGICSECDNSDIEIIPCLDEDTNEIVPDYAICMNCSTEYDIYNENPQQQPEIDHESVGENPF